MIDIKPRSHNGARIGDGTGGRYLDIPLGVQKSGCGTSLAYAPALLGDVLTQHLGCSGGRLMLDQIRREIESDPYYKQNFSNDGQRLVAWYLRRVLLRDDVATRDDITDGQNDKQIDALLGQQPLAASQRMTPPRTAADAALPLPPK
jgi:hypothetical protein